MLISKTCEVNESSSHVSALLLSNCGLVSDNMHEGQLISGFQAPEEWMFHQRWCSHLLNLKHISPIFPHASILKWSCMKNQQSKQGKQNSVQCASRISEIKVIALRRTWNPSMFGYPQICTDRREVEIGFLWNHGLFRIFGANLLWPQTQTVQFWIVLVGDYTSKMRL